MHGVMSNAIKDLSVCGITQLTVRQIDMLKLSRKKIMIDILLNMSLISCLLYINYYISLQLKKKKCVWPRY